MSPKRCLEAGVGYYLSEPVYDDWLVHVIGEQNRALLWYHYGFQDGQARTFEKTGEMFAMPERVAQVRIMEGLRQLRILAYNRNRETVMPDDYVPFEGDTPHTTLDYDPWEVIQVPKDVQRTTFAM